MFVSILRHLGEAQPKHSEMTPFFVKAGRCDIETEGSYLSSKRERLLSAISCKKNYLPMMTLKCNTIKEKKRRINIDSNVTSKCYY